MAGRRNRRLGIAALALLLAALIAVRLRSRAPSPSMDSPSTDSPNTAPIAFASQDGMLRLPGGRFQMGSPHAKEVDAHPVRLVRLAPFWIDQTPVTNAQFDRFVQQTHYETTAERRGHSLVFDRQQSAWREVAGVSWQHPENPNSSLAGKEQYPVVHVSWHDAVAYAAWADKRLPSEAEYEYAARGGLLDCDYPWGRVRAPGAVQLANSWQGPFPEEDLGLDGFRGTSPVQQFPPNRFGLYDMAGNVCCWCADWYAVNAYNTSPADQPAGPTSGTQRVRRGGSWLAAPSPPDPLRTGHRDHAPPGETTNHTGFRCARLLE